MESHECMSRRAALRRVVRWGPLAAFIACSAASFESRAGKAAKQDFAYQEMPKQGKSCSGCRQFTPGSAGPGRCAVVDGDISPHGWCMAYSPRD